MLGQPSLIEPSSRNHGNAEKGYSRRPEEYEGDSEPGRPGTLPFSPPGDCAIIQRKTTPVVRQDRRSDDEALDLPARSRFGEGGAETSYRLATGPQTRERIPFVTSLIANNSK